MEKSLRRLEAAIPGALTAAGMVVVTRTQRIFVIFRPRGTATGATWRSITVSPPFVDARGYTRVRVGPHTTYAKELHEGRPPGKRPPVEPDDAGGGYSILDWVREKGIGDVKSQRSIAYAIATNIGKYGTKPFPYLRVGFDMSRKEAVRVFTAVLAKELAQQWRR
jgi:hypothetical protein